MRQALKEAEQAFSEDEVPIGAIVVINNKIIARGYNQTEKLNDCTAHAEMIALTSAFNHLGSKYLPEATLYVTIEPCLMCCGAMYWSKIGRVVFGGEDEKNGYQRFLQQSSPQKITGFFHPKTQVIKGILQHDCVALMKDFFKAKR